MLKISLLHAPDYMILTPKIEKSPYRGRGDTPSPRSLASLPRICSKNIFCVFLQVRNHLPPPPHFWRPVYATEEEYQWKEDEMLFTL